MTAVKRLFPLYPAALVLLLWGVILVALPPARQEFPLNDDWAYSKGAFAFARGEGIHYFRQPSMPLLGQWLLAYPVIRAAGESHTALRLLTVALSVLGALALYDLLRREPGASALSAPEASFAAATLATNPLYFLMAGTFMSDVSALALSLLALASYTRALECGRFGWWASGAALAIVAALDRQNTIVTPAVAFLLLWRNRALRWHPAWLCGVLIPAATVFAVNSWFASRPDAVPLAPSLPRVSHLFALQFAGVLYLGLSTLPLLALRPGVVTRWAFVLALLALTSEVSACVVFGDNDLFPNGAYYHYYRGLFPYLQNIITPWGTLESGAYVVGERPLMMGYGAQVLVTAAGCIGGAALVDRLIGRLRCGTLATPLVLFSALHLLLLVVSPTLYDRYIIVLMPGALALASAVPCRLRWPMGLGVLAILAVCSAGLMHDWVAWNSARWDLGRRALAR
jgi:hypothetical protein